MSQKWITMAVMCISLVVLVSCNNYETGMTEEKQLEAIQLQTGDTAPENNEKDELKKVYIYYGNGAANELRREEVSVNEVTANTLLGLLARHNIVSIDTKAVSFKEDMVGEKKVIKLDLSGQFEDYISMMGPDGEKMVIEGLTNTFLEAYDAESLELTVNGETLKTKNQEYSKPLQFKNEAYGESQENPYTLEEVKQQTDTMQIVYPQFQGMKNEKQMQQWNTNIKSAVMAGYDVENTEYYKITYEIATQNAGMVSIVVRGESMYSGATYPSKIEFTFNFDLTTGENQRLKEYANLEQLAECLQNGYDYEVLDEGISREDVTAYLTSGSQEDLEKVLQNYDYDFSNKNVIPTGYSYIKDDQTLVLVVEVNHALGDYLEIQMK